MIPEPAQYLLRFDDLCPTIVKTRWQRLLSLIEEFGIHPILGVIPDNQDRKLHLAPEDPTFWQTMRSLQAAGATVALHGYRHMCSSFGNSLVPLHADSEFAGVPEETQRRWIRAGLEILRREELDPKIWVAPRHGFDAATLRCLRKEGIGVLSDGFARRPFTRQGMTWIPQQLWGPLDKPSGLWTICIHSNSTRKTQVEELRAFLKLHAARFTSVDRVLAEYKPEELSLSERLQGAWMLARVKLSRARKKRNRRHR